MNVEAQTAKNTEDISKVTAAVDKLALTMQFEMDRGKEERDNIKSMVTELRGLNEKMGSIASIQLEIVEIKGVLEKYRHDLKNLENAQQSIPLMKKDLEENTKNIAVLENKDSTCKEWRDKHDGAADAMRTAVRAMWAVSGTGVAAIAYFVLNAFFHHSVPNGG